jgi:hypothetical protein
VPIFRRDKIVLTQLLWLFIRIDVRGSWRSGGDSSRSSRATNINTILYVKLKHGENLYLWCAAHEIREGAFQIVAFTVRRENNIGNTPEVLRYRTFPYLSKWHFLSGKI